jgi:DNA-binding NtrC family response regulator
MEEVRRGRFREDLFHRIAVAVLSIPPLRERREDIGLLMDHLLGQINRESAGQPGHSDKRLSVAARKVLIEHSWPGNIRELHNTLLRLVIWTTGEVVGAEDARVGLLRLGDSAETSILRRPLGDGFALPDLMSEVARHYLARALDEAHGNKTQAAKLLGLGSYQTLSNWLARHGDAAPCSGSDAP